MYNFSSSLNYDSDSKPYHNFDTTPRPSMLSIQQPVSTSFDIFKPIEILPKNSSTPIQVSIFPSFTQYDISAPSSRSAFPLNTWLPAIKHDPTTLPHKSLSTPLKPLIPDIPIIRDSLPPKVASTPKTSSAPTDGHAAGLGITTELMMNGQKHIATALNTVMIETTKSNVALGVAAGAMKVAEPLVVAAFASVVAERMLNSDSKPAPAPCSMEAFTNDIKNGAIAGGATALAEATVPAIVASTASGGTLVIPSGAYVIGNTLAGTGLGAALGAASSAVNCSMSLAAEKNAEIQDLQDFQDFQDFQE